MTRSPTRGRLAWWRGLAIGAPLLCAVYGVARPDDVLVGGAAWTIVILASLAGYGHVAERVAGARVELGLRLAWGAAAYLAIAGCFLAAGALTRPVLAILLVVGGAAYVWRQIRAEWPAPARPRIAGVDGRPRRAAMIAVIAAIAAVNVVAALVELQGNVYDDDVIYTPLVRRLLDVGDLDEPYSFRRISSYGGQTVLQGLAALRGTLDSLFLLDGAVFQIIVLLQIVGMARRPDQTRASGGPDADPVDDAVLGLLLLVVVLLPDTAVNTASHWTGLCLFLALYRTVTVAGGACPAAPAFAIAGGVAAATCTMRQSYLPVATLFLLLGLVLRLWPDVRARWPVERRSWWCALAGGAVALVPYCVAAWRSNETFLYPLWLGTFNPDVRTTPTVLGAWQELAFFLRVLVEPDPVRVVLIVFPVLAIVVDRRAGRPLTAFTIASGIGLAALVHSFTLSTPLNLWRYAFGYATALFAILVIEAGRQGLRPDDDDAPVAVPRVARLVVVASLVVQLAISGRGILKKYADLASDVAAATAPGHGGHARVRETYARLQAAVPAGAAVAVMLDEPYHLDYARNRILNLDTPGFASERPGMPSFRGHRPVIAYLLERGIRHLAFVRGDRSRYMYRRDYWLHRMLWDTELWRVQGAYTVDTLENFTAIAAERRVLFEEDGLVVVDLEAAP